MKRTINRGTSSVWASVNPTNWCGDSFRKFLKEKMSKSKLSQKISLNRGTSSISARDIPERTVKKVRAVLSCARGTSTRILNEEHTN